MPRSLKSVVLVVVTAATVLVATQAQAEVPDRASPVVLMAAPTPRDTGAGTTETEFVPIAPCRLYDTRQGQGRSPIGVGGLRDIKVKGPESTPGQYAGQGGRAGGCGIPVGVAAIEATVTAVSPAGTGFLRLWPSGQPETSSTFLNYIRGFNPTNTGALAICTAGCGAGSDLRVKAFGAATHVAIDVQGYYAKPLAAWVDRDGNLVHGSRVVATTRVTPGQYRVQFDRPVHACVAMATPDGLSGRAFAMVGVDDSAPTRLFVFTSSVSGSNVDRGFHIEVTC